MNHVPMFWNALKHLREARRCMRELTAMNAEIRKGFDDLEEDMRAFGYHQLNIKDAKSRKNAVIERERFAEDDSR